MNLDIESLPEYLRLSNHEKGASLGLSSPSYSCLARCALSITKAFPSFMAVYTKRNNEACLLDIFPEAKEVCLTIHIQDQELRLFTAQMDSPDMPSCLLDTANSKQGFEELQDTAKSYLSAS